MKTLQFYVYSQLHRLFFWAQDACYKACEHFRCKMVQSPRWAEIVQQEANFRGNAAQIPITHVLSILTTSSEMPSQMPIVTDNLPFERFCVDCEWEGFDSHCEHEYHGGEIIEVCPLCRGFVADTKHAKQAIQAGATFDNQIPF